MEDFITNYDNNINNFDKAESSQIEKIIDENENEITDNNNFKYMSPEMLDSAVQLNMNNYFEDLSNDNNSNIKVYAKVNEDGYIVDISSDIFLKDISDWIQIDEGKGDKFAHAKSQYFNDGLINKNAEFIHKIN
ncbi:MAG: hypothetical protein IJX17_03785 [Clostridia bacterium]|nr:hypothetical protein [Clostridia bacterium]